MLEIRRLKLAGYPFRADDLKYRDWLLLGALEEKLGSEQKKNELELTLLKTI